VNPGETKKGVKMKKELSPKQRDELLAALKARFDASKARHPGLVWAKVQAR
jgi:F0F1-type ATP synthase delta subunit